jgi:hypothetical protein
MKDFAIGLTIAIMLPFVVYYGALSFSPAAKYQGIPKENFVKQHEGELSKEKKTRQVQVEILEQEYQTGISTFNKHLFFIAVPIGISVIGGGLAMSVPGISTGLMFGGLFTLIYGYFTYWSDLPVRVRFFSLAIGLVLFILIGWIKFGKKNRSIGLK